MHHLTLLRAKELLPLGEEALRNRDPFLSVTLEVATSSDILSRGEGMTICAGVAASPFGNCLIGETSRGICHLSFFDDADRDHAVSQINADWPLAVISWDDAFAASHCKRIFAPQAGAAPLKLFVRGTPFQLQVWRALLRVPPGALVSYGALAAAIGNLSASRATGTAVGSNRIAYLIPCHRVIRGAGNLGHYRWGAARKHAMLEWEAAMRVPNLHLPQATQTCNLPQG